MAVFTNINEEPMKVFGCDIYVRKDLPAGTEIIVVDKAELEREDRKRELKKQALKNIMGWKTMSKEETIEQLRNQNAELRDELEVKNAELNKEKEKNKSYDKLLEKYNKLVCCHLQYEEMTGIDLLLPDTVDVISKDKIRAKIEEYKEILKSNIINDRYNVEVNNIIRVLQELLEE